MGASVLIKICGLTSAADAAVAVEAGADLLGFVLVPGTPRAVDPERAGWIREVHGAERVGVFRNASLDEIRRVRDRLRLDRIQLHGEEPDEWLERLGPGVVRRVPVPGAVDWSRVRWLEEAGALPLLDPGAGDGVAFDWRLLDGRPGGVRFGLAGGLTPASVAAAIRAARPILVDVSSGVEAEPGIKDGALVRAFVAAAQRRGNEAP
jgi:phosphoribosylanthranilate isomerase